MKPPPALLFLAVLHTLAFSTSASDIICHKFLELHSGKKIFVTNFHFITNRFTQTPPNLLPIFQKKKQKTVRVEVMEFPGVLKKK